MINKYHIDISLGKLFSIYIRTKLLTQTCHFNFPERDVMPRYIKIVKVNMKSNGPRCTTKRWWVYIPKGAFHIDIDSSLFR